MAMKMSREGRWLDICTYCRYMERMDGDGSSIGQYCRQKGISKSPYIIGEFKYLVSAGILTEDEQEYKATGVKLYKPNLAVISNDYPQLYQTLTDNDQQMRLGL